MAQLHYHSIFSKSYAAIVFLLLLVLLSVACSNSEAESVSTAAPKLTAAEVVELSKTSMGNIDSFSFQLTHDSGHTTLSGALQLTRASGFVATDGLDLQAEASIGRLFVKVEAVVIGQQTWMTNPITGVWSEIAPEDSPFAFLDPVKLTADILGDTQQTIYAKDDQASNSDIEISGKIPAKSLASLVGYVNTDAIPNVVITIDSSSNLLKKIIIFGAVQSEDEPDTIRVITLSDFDEPSTIEPPI